MNNKESYYKQESHSGHPDENELAQYAEYLRNENDGIPDDLKAHVESCSYCRAEIMAITDMLDEIPDMVEEESPQSAVGRKPSDFVGEGPVGPPSSVVGSRQKRVLRITWLRAAAAVAAIFLIAWAILQFLPARKITEPVAINTPKPDTRNPIPDTQNPSLSSSRTRGPIPVTQNPSLSSSRTRGPIPDTLLYASAFIPNPAFENLVSAKYRSGSDPLVKGPAPEKIFAPGDTLALTWTPELKENYHLVIIDNKSNTIKEMKAGPEPRLAWKIDLKPGLYYWKFLGKDEMWKVGRLKVIKQ